MQYFSVPHPSSASQAFPELTEWEGEDVALIAGGWNNQGIAKHLGLTLKTVRNYVSSILSKLQVADWAQAIVRARKAGMCQ